MTKVRCLPPHAPTAISAAYLPSRMTQEHVGMAIALNVPLFVVITKVDLCPEPVMKETIKQARCLPPPPRRPPPLHHLLLHPVRQLLKLLKLPGARKQPYAARQRVADALSPM